MSVVYVVKRHDTDTWNPGRPVLVAICMTHEGARQWISDETQGLHPESGWSYTKTPDVDWWIDYGAFTIEEVTVFP